MTLMHAAPSVTTGALEGFDAVTLRAGPLAATFVPGAGMLGASLTHAGEELLAQLGGVAAYAERGTWMGIPFLHPWANRLAGDAYEVAGREARVPAGSRLFKRDPHGLPIHGLLPGFADWRLGSTTADAEHAHVVATLDFPGHEAFPFPHRAELAIALDAGALTIATTVTATGDAPVPVAFGFHPYLRLPGTPRADWIVSLPQRRQLLADARGLPTGETVALPAEREALAARAFDDGFDGLPAVPRFEVTDGARTLAVTFLSGYRVAQVFAPPPKDHICFEPMTAPTNALVTGRDLPLIAPGESYAAAFEIRVGA
jgi:galactose mutarotase-like enzyme